MRDTKTNRKRHSEREIDKWIDRLRMRNIETDRYRLRDSEWLIFSVWRTSTHCGDK